MGDGFDYEATGAILESGRVITHAANVAALAAAAGCIFSAHPVARACFGAACLSWAPVCYFAARVAIDVRLFRLLAETGEDGGDRLDRTLHGIGVTDPRPARTPQARIAGGIQHWRSLLYSFLAEVVFALGGIVAVWMVW